MLGRPSVADEKTFVVIDEFRQAGSDCEGRDQADIPCGSFDAGTATLRTA